MQIGRYLSPSEQANRRTIVDALDVLRALPAFNSAPRIQIRIGILCLPSGTETGLINIELTDGDQVFIASLPTSSRFLASRIRSHERDVYEISLLDGASVDAFGTVQLLDGTQLYSVEVIPANLPYEPTPTDWRIIRNVIEMLDAHDQCFRPYWENAPEGVRHSLPDTEIIDCHAVSQLKVKYLDRVRYHIQDYDPTFEVSQQKIADTLAMFGVRQPARRPRRPSV